MEPDFLRIGTCSLASVPGEIDENLEKIKTWILKAIPEKIDLLLFPELSLSGYWWNTELLYTAQVREGPAIQDLIKFLNEKQTEMVISVGLAELYGGCIYNTQIALSKNGILSAYRKTHWPHAEMGTWGCGDRYHTFQLNGFTIGTAICYDNSFPEVHRIYALMGTDLILSPYAYGGKYDPAKPETVAKVIKDWKTKEKISLQCGAMANYQWIVGVVGGGTVKDYIAEKNPDKGQICYFPGVSLFISPDGKIVKESPDDEIAERLMWADVSRFSNIEARRSNYNFFKDRRTSTYGRICELP